MTIYEKQDSNFTGLSLAQETSLGVVDGSTIWVQQEPNSYRSFGGNYKLVPRNPINAARQPRKGTLTDLDASGSWQEDLTYLNTQPWIEGVFFADMHRKAELSITTVDNGTSAYQPASGGGVYAAGDILFAKGFSQAANNGVKSVTSGATSSVVVTPTLASEAGASGIISKVGFQFASGDATFSNSGGVISLLTTAKDLTTLGINIGEWVFVGGDSAASKFATVGNNGYARVLSISAGAIVFDKVNGVAPTTDAGTGKTIQLYFGRFLKNESNPSLIKRRTYQAERQLGKADTTSSYMQAEYLTKSTLDTFMVTFNSADKVTFDLATVSGNYETRDSTVGPKAGQRPVLVSGGAFNTSTDLVRTALSVCGQSTPLFARLMDMAITVNNNCKLNKSLGTLGAFDVTAGEFVVSVAGNAYFATVAALDAVRNNEDLTYDAIIARDNIGIAFDLPLVAIGDGGVKVSANQPITLPITLDAATAASLNPTTDYVMSMTYFDYLPNAAMGA